MIYLGLNEVRFPCRVSSLVTCKILDTDSTIFEIQTTDNQKKYFLVTVNANCEEWVSAIRSTGKVLMKTQRKEAKQRSQKADHCRHSQHRRTWWWRWRWSRWTTQQSRCLGYFDFIGFEAATEWDCPWATAAIHNGSASWRFLVSRKATKSF